MSNAKKMSVSLTERQRATLEKIVAFGSRSAQSNIRARALLLLAAGTPDTALAFKEVAQTARLTVRALREVRRRFHSEGLDAAVGRRARETPPNIFFNHKALKKQVMTVVCGRPPEGLTHWSLRLIRRKLIDDGSVQTISLPTINKVLLKLNLSLSATPLEIRRQIRARGLLPRGVQIGKGEKRVKIKQYTAEPQRNIRHVRIVSRDHSET